MSRPYFRSAGVEAGGTGNVTPALPTDWAEDDILLLAVQSCNQAITAPAGYTEVASSPQGTGTAASAGSTRLGLFWKRATSSESAPTVTDTGDHTYAAILAFAGCVKTGSPIDVEAGAVEAVASNTVTCPSVTTTVDKALIVNVVAEARDGGGAHFNDPVNASLLGNTRPFDGGTSQAFGGGIGVFTGLKEAAGSSGSTTSALNTVDTTLQGLITLALKPEVSDAPYYIGAGTIDSTSGAATINPGLPGGWAQNDIFLLLVETANQAIATPTGYTEVTNSPQGTGTAGAAGATRLGVFWKRATVSESAPAITTSGDHTVARVLAFRGVVTSGDPYEASAGDVEASSVTGVTFPGLTTLGDDRAVLFLHSIDTDSLSAVQHISGWANAALEYVAELIDVAANNSNGGGLAAAIGLMSSAGAIGATTATLSPAAVQGRVVLAFAPAAGGGGAWVPRIVVL